MDEEKLIQVSFQIPPSALDSLSRLAEQLRWLTEAVSTQTLSGSRPAETERGKSESFDPERFAAMWEGADMEPKAVEAALSDIKDARTVSSATSQTGDAETVSAKIQKDLQDAKGAGDAVYNRPESPAEAEAVRISPQALQEEQDVPRVLSEKGQENSWDKIPTVQAEAEATIADAPEALRKVEQQMPDTESARAEAEARALALTAARGEVSGVVETPLGAGVIVQAQPETPQSRWSGVTEELVIPGPAPLTAEAVSLAFERDGRRYDNGFPLY